MMYFPAESTGLRNIVADSTIVKLFRIIYENGSTYKARQKLNNRSIWQSLKDLYIQPFAGKFNVSMFGARDLNAGHE